MHDVFRSLAELIGQIGPLRSLIIALTLTVLCYFFLQGFGPKSPR